MSRTLSTGERIGDYEILRAIQSGGMGEVLLGRKYGADGFEKLFAIKTVRSDLREMQAVRTMFADEARILSRLAHPAIAQIHDFGEQNGLLYLVMEYVSGLDFRELMKLDPPPGIACRAVAEVCRGLHAAHELRDLAGHPLGVVHRDVSPENLMLTFDGRVKVLDFGIALIRDRKAPTTEFGAIKGKPPYLSPEQVKGEDIDRRTDVFSASIVLYELLTGEQLFEGGSIYAIARAIEHRDIPPPSRKAGALPDGLDQAVLRGLERNPASRHQSAQLMAEELSRIATLAGAESLEWYTERELSTYREEHRQSLHALLRQDDAPDLHTRPTGAVTAIAFSTTDLASSSIALPATEADPIDASADDPTVRDSASADHANDAHLNDRNNPRDAGEMREPIPLERQTLVAESIPPRAADAPPAALTHTTNNDRSRRWVLLAMFILVGVVIGYVAVIVYRGDSVSLPGEPRLTQERMPPTVTTPDAGSDADAAGPFASESRPNAIPRDAGALPDARIRNTTSTRSRRRRASKKPTETTIEPGAKPGAEPGAEPGAGETDKPKDKRPPPAMPPVTPKGFGLVSITADPFANVRIDGKAAGNTPIFNLRLPAGTHEIVLVNPATGAVLLRRTFDLAIGAHERVKPK